ncbi:MAG: AAA family ATPase [Parcubacteria group bacterium]|nr:AAA family ATPase [Parcubacteria group bacterium]
MILKRLELSGFKSFARPSTLEFRTPITAIVGPNGSGKSNIAEAFRFVLGEQSIKSLRGKRGEDLIFNGTQSIPRQAKASVAIIFDNSKRVLNIDYDEVVIKRIVYRDSTSEYLVNGTRVRLKDILEMLSSVHIGASSHHIVSQGEADRILLASIKERRSMIEDALGLKIYHYKKLESERKLNKTNENLGQVKALKKEVEPHLRFLEKQVAKIKQAEELRGELKNLYTIYFGREGFYLQSEKKRLEAERQNPQKELATVESSIKNIEKILRTVETGKQTAIELIEIEKKIENIRQKHGEISRALGKIEGVVEYEQRKLGEEERKMVEKKDIVISEEVLTEFRFSISTFVENAKNEETAETLRSLIHTIYKNVESFCEKLIHKNTGGILIARLKESLEQRRNEQKNLEHEIERIKEEEHQLVAKRIALQKNVAEKAGAERESERELFALQNKKTELTAQLHLIRMQEEQFNILQSEFDLFLKEAQALIGVLSYSTRDITDVSEDRALQNERKNKILRIKIKLEEIGVGGGEILKEYKEIKERDEFLEKEITDLEKSAKSLTDLIEELEKKIDGEFKNGVQKINKNFQELFAIMFGGGKASIRVITPKKQKKSDETVIEDEDIDGAVLDEAEPEEGLDISVSLPRKKVKGLMMLSGGERALVSIALIFAMTRVNPPPFLILDETDAALDEVNSRKYGEMLKNLAKETELILITHNRETMSHAGVLYGVTAIDGVSRLLSVKFDEAEHFVEKN